MASAAELLLLIKGDASGAEKALQGAGASVSNIGGNLTKLGMPAMAAAGAIAGVGVASVMAAADFQTQMKQVATLGADFGKPFTEVEKEVSALATSMGIDAVDAANTLYNAVSAGVPPGNALEFMEAAAKAAVGGAAELSAVGSTLSVVMNSWGDAAGSATEISDGLFQVVKMGVTTMPELAAAIGGVSGIAGAAGVSFEETGAAIAQITTKGKTTSVAVTQLKGVIAELMTPTSRSAKALQELGYESAAAAIEQEGFQGTLQLLEKAAADAGVPVTALFGSVEAGAAMLDLTGGNTGDFTDKLEGMQGAAGNSEAALAIVNEGFSRQIDLVKSLATGALRDIGMALLPSLTEALQNARPHLESLTERVSEFAARLAENLPGYIELLKTKMEEWRPTIERIFGFLQEHSGTIAKVGIAFGALSTVAAILGPPLMVLGPIISGVGSVIGFLVPVIGGIVGILGGPLTIAILAVVGLFLLWKLKGDEIKAALSSAFERIKGAISGAVDGIKAAIGSVKDWIVSHKDMIINALLLLTGPIGALAVLWREKGDEIKAALQDVADRVRGWVDDLRQRFEDVRASIDEKITAVKTFLVDTWHSILEFISATVESIRVGISQGWDRIKAYLTTTLDSILRLVDRVWAGIQSSIDRVLGAVQRIIGDALSWIESTFGLRMDGVQRLVDAAFTAMRTVVDTVISTIQGIISGFLLFLQGDFQGGVSAVIESVKGFFSGMAKAVGTALGALKTAVETGIANVVAVFQPIIDKIQELTGIDLYEVGKALLEGLQKGIRAAFGAVQGAITALASLLPDWIKRALGMESPSKVFRQIGHDLVEGLILGIRDQFEAAAGVVFELVQGAGSAAVRAVEDMRGVGLAGTGREYWEGVVGAGVKATARWGTFDAGAMDSSMPSLLRTSDALLNYIRTAGFGQIQGNALAEWMRRMGYDEQTIEKYRDLRQLRGERGWLTPEARALFRRRTILTGGDWTGGYAEGAGGMPDALVSRGGGEAGSALLQRFARPGPVGTTSDPVSVSVEQGQLKGDLTVSDRMVFEIKLSERVIDSIVVEVIRKMNGGLVVAPIGGTP